MTLHDLAKEEKYMRRERRKQEIIKYLKSDRFTLLLLALAVALSIYMCAKGG
jgi:hypothetical protein